VGGTVRRRALRSRRSNHSNPTAHGRVTAVLQVAATRRVLRNHQRSKSKSNSNHSTNRAIQRQRRPRNSSSSIRRTVTEVKNAAVATKDSISATRLQLVGQSLKLRTSIIRIRRAEETAGLRDIIRKHPPIADLLLHLDAANHPFDHRVGEVVVQGRERRRGGRGTSKGPAAGGRRSGAPRSDKLVKSLYNRMFTHQKWMPPAGPFSATDVIKLSLYSNTYQDAQMNFCLVNT